MVFDRRVFELAQDDIQHLSACLLVFVEYPTKFQSNSVMENLIQKVSNVKSDGCLNQALGLYYKIKEVLYEVHYFIVINLRTKIL